MDTVLIISSTNKGKAFFLEMLSQDSYKEIVTLNNSGEARRLLIDRDFDLCIINAPLSDEFGDRLARTIAERNASQVIIVVKTELFDEISLKVEDMGVFTIAKPINKCIFWSLLKIANATFNKLTRLKQENTQLLQKIEDIKVIDRAKLILIEHLNMTEPDAHRYIEKRAMDTRKNKREIAEIILKTYRA